MASDATSIIGSKQLAGTIVNPRGMFHKVMTKSNPGFGAGLSGPVAGLFLKKEIKRERLEAAESSAPDFGSHGYLALSAEEVVLMNTKKGMFAAKPDSVLTRALRSDIAGASLGDGMAPGLTLLFDDGRAWSFDVPPANKKQAKALIDELSGAAAG